MAPLNEILGGVQNGGVLVSEWGRSGFRMGAFWFQNGGVLFTEMGARMGAFWFQNGGVLVSEWGRSGFRMGAFLFSEWGVLDPFDMNSIPNNNN